jgi:hypothetical protein
VAKERIRSKRFSAEAEAKIEQMNEKRDQDRSKLILHLFEALYEERQDTWLQTECGVLVGTCNGSHDIAKAWETPTCPACKVVWDKHQPKPRKWHDGVPDTEILLRARDLLAGAYEGTTNRDAIIAHDFLDSAALMMGEEPLNKVQGE